MMKVMDLQQHEKISCDLYLTMLIYNMQRIITIPLFVSKGESLPKL